MEEQQRNSLHYLFLQNVRGPKGRARFVLREKQADRERGDFGKEEFKRLQRDGVEGSEAKLACLPPLEFLFQFVHNGHDQKGFGLKSFSTDNV